MFKLFRLALLSSAASVAMLSAAAAESGPGLEAGVAGLPFKVDAEYTYSWAPAAVNAGSAHARGWTGAGQTVAIFDTGLASRHSEFSGRIVTGYDAIRGRVGVPSTDPGIHGTFVAGIVGAARNGRGMEGIAYDAKLMAIRIANSDGSITLSDAKLARGINYATPRSKTFNNSWNSASTIADLSKSSFSGWYANSLNAWRNAVNNNVIVVWAAGNEGKSQPGVFGALPSWYSELSRGWVVTVATDKTGAIASYSNRCGSAASWCLAAPGTSIISTYGSSGYGIGSGTSFAAPVVSGGAALLKQMWPSLTNADIRSILFTTANKSGIYANAAIYGQGLLDLDKATQPVGTVSVASGPTVQQKTGTKTSTATTSGAFGAAMSKSSHTVMVLDDYNRDYAASLSAFVAPQAAPYDMERGLFNLGAALTTVEVAAGTRFSFAADDLAYGDKLPRFALQLQSGANDHIALIHGVSSSQMFGGAEADVDAAAILPQASGVSSAFRNLAGPQATGMSWRTGVGDGVNLTLATLFGRVDDRPSDWAPVSPYAERSESESGVTVTAARLTAPLGPVQLGFESGLVMERNTLLGSASEGAMSLGDGATTGYIGLSAEAQVGWGVTLFGGFEMGRSTVQAVEGSMVSGMSDLTSTAFRLGATKSGVIEDGDRFAVALSQPLRVSAGTAFLDLPVSRDLDGNVYRSAASQTMAADGRELDLQLGYSRPLGENQSLSAAGMLRLEPDNIKDAAPEGIVMFGYKLAF